MFNKKIKIEIKSIFGDVLFTHKCVDNTIAKTVEEAVKSYADLRYTNLSYANLSSVNLSSADLSYANLSSANLSYAKTDKRYIQIGCIGSSKRVTTYCFEDDEITCGCFKGILKEFEKQVKETHKNNKQYLNEYLGAIKYIKSIAKDTPKQETNPKKTHT